MKVGAGETAPIIAARRLSMEKLPTWVKVVAALVLFAALYGGAQLLLYVDKSQNASRFGIN
jgi:hypothetical protein